MGDFVMGISDGSRRVVAEQFTDTQSKGPRRDPRRDKIIQRTCVLAFLVLLGLTVAVRWTQIDRVAVLQPAAAQAEQPAAEQAAAAAAPVVEVEQPAAAAAQKPALTCAAPMEHTELWGDVVVPGFGPGAATAASPAECCELCACTRGCNVWVACSNEQACQKQCWLKWQVRLCAEPVTPLNSTYCHILSYTVCDSTP
ncbi:hypothetical protein T492DRAFT_1117584 [Pavlovales sp. CCMP2436]|nr:hypothetical protein T492DRAFT_1117584 [Pavlovales sp. CCMP2436]